MKIKINIIRYSCAALVYSIIAFLCFKYNYPAQLTVFRNYILVVSFLLLLIRREMLSVFLFGIGMEFWLFSFVCTAGELTVLLIVLFAYSYLLVKKSVKVIMTIEWLLTRSLNAQAARISSVLLFLYQISHGRTWNYYIFAGDLEFLKGNQEKAIDSYTKGRNNGNLFDITYRIGNCYYSISDYEKSLNRLLKKSF